MDNYRDRIKGFTPAEREILRQRLAAWAGQESAPRKAKTLAAYYVSRDALSPEEVRKHLQERLPDHMLPVEFIAVEAIPKTSNGKVDRTSLQRLRSTFGNESKPALASIQTPSEEKMSRIWSRILNLTSLGIHDNFFQLGGHSLLATQVIMEIETVFGMGVPLNTIFKFPTVHQLCRHLDETGPLRRPLTKTGPEVLPAHVPLSNAQRRLWYASQLTDTGLEYKIIKIIEITGRLNGTALAQSVTEIVRRHQSLRTSFGYVTGKLVQKINPVESVAIRYVDLSAQEPVGQDHAYREIERGIGQEKFDLENGPLMRVTLVKFASEKLRLFFDVHHIVIDGWSFGILVNELNTLYSKFSQGRPSELPPLPLQYSSYVLWEKERLTKAVLESQLSYWRNKLQGAPRLEFKPARTDARERDDGEVEFDLGAELSGRIAAVCKRIQSTQFIFLTSVYYVLLHHHSDATDLSIGADVANRDSKDFSQLIGFFVNQLVLRVRLDPSLRFDQLCQRTRECVEEAFANKDVPYDTLVRELRSKSSDPARDSLFRAKFVFHHELPGVALPGIETTFMEVRPRMRKFDLLLSVEEGKHGLKGKVEYSGSIFEEGMVARMIEHYRTLCRLVTDDVTSPLASLRECLSALNLASSRRVLSEARAARSKGLRTALQGAKS